jgi:hypothetical protein
MTQSANVRSLEAICRFASAVLQFQSEARMCLTAMDSQLRQVQQWLERDRPSFWRHEIQKCSHEMSEARIRLHQCRMRQIGDFRPTCYEEQKALQAAVQAHEFSQQQIPTVKHWIIQTQHESNEFRGRAGQLQQMLDRDIPRLLALLQHSIRRIEEYLAVETPDSAAPRAPSKLTEFAELLLRQLSEASESLSEQQPTGEESANSGNAGPAADGHTLTPAAEQFQSGQSVTQSGGSVDGKYSGTQDQGV